jgi:hypothetical protein
MNVIQRYFPKHLEKMSETLDEPLLIEYEQKADETVKLITWISLASLLILIIGEVGFSSSRLFSKWCSLGVLIFIQIISLLLSYRKFYPMLRPVLDIRTNWNMAVFVASALGTWATCICVFEFMTLINCGVNEEENIFTCPQAKMTVHIPPGFTDVTYEKGSNSGSICWYVENNETVIWVYTYIGWSYTETYEDPDGNEHSILESHYDSFVRSDKMYYKGGMKFPPEMVEINSLPAYVSYGRRDRDVDYEYIVYRLHRNDALICVTYAYSGKLDDNEQRTKAYEFVSDMEFK